MEQPVTTPQPNRLDRFAAESVWTFAWHLVTAGVVVMASHALWERTPVWALKGDGIAQASAIAGAFLLTALVGRTTSRERSIVRAVGLAVAAGISFAATWFWLTRWGITPSRRLLAGGALMTWLLLLVPIVRTRLRLLALAGVAALGVALALRDRGRAPDPPRRQAVARAMHYTLNLTTLVGLLPTPATPMHNGGAITRDGDGFLAVTDAGEFFRLTWGPIGDSLRATRLDLRPPFNRAEFHADQPGGRSATTFRITDVLVDERPTPRRLLLAHQYWNHDARCITLRVSATDLADAPSTGAATWQTLFESQPCLTLDGPLQGQGNHEVGGVMALHPRGLLLTLGSNRYDGLAGERPFAQDSSVSYGKILLIDAIGKPKIWSMGHRNPVGLLVDRAGRIWSTEHGPRHGDELNLIREGGNYGWPMVTYGAQYGMDVWPLAPASLDHGEYDGPAYAFIPAPGLARLVQVGSEQLPLWRGDLLMVSLVGTTLFRVRLHRDQVVYVEAIPLDTRVRDIDESLDGRFVMWTDAGEVVVVSRRERIPLGDRVYEGTCAGCHGTATSVARAAPDLRGVVGRAVASVPGFQYSPALRALGGRWTPARLDSLLANPATFAPGSSMNLLGPIDAESRSALLSFLTTYGQERESPAAERQP
jgi:cytochrome c2